MDSIREIFSKVLDASAVERDAILAALPDADRREILTLLRAYQAAGSFLESAAEQNLFGQIVGPYRLLEVIGRGGMGIVYRAERQDGAFQKQVAVKFAFPGPLGPETSRRFIEERRILSALDHASIVHMLDAGTWRGRRYLVMELVEGVPIDAHVRSAKPPVREIIRLFQKLCDPIQYAHQRLVIHRDLKPGNVLVTAEGRVKILDFGIARLLDSQTGDSVLHPFTLAYASPEQLRGEVLTPAADIYSLAVMLSELLTGRNPQLGETNDETRQRILTAAPAPPTGLADLDAIVAKALAKDTVDRYATVADLRADLDRYLAGKPVAARQHRWTYVASRFVMRNRAVTAALAALLLVSGAMLSNHFSDLARQKRQLAQSRAMIRSVIVDLQPKLERLAGSVEVRKELIDRSIRYLDQLTADAGSDADVLADLAEAYTGLALLQGSDHNGSLGDFQGASRSHSAAEEVARRLLEVSLTPRAIQVASLVHLNLSHFRGSQEGYKAGRADAERSVELAAERERQTPHDYSARADLAAAYYTLALTQSGKPRMAKLRDSLSKWRELAVDFPEREAVLRAQSRILKTLAANLEDVAVGEEPLRLQEEALALDRRILHSEPGNADRRMDLSFSLSQMGTFSAHRHDYQKAVQYLEEVRRIREDIVKANPLDLRSLDRLGFALRNLGLYKIRAGNQGEGEQDFARGHQIARDLHARHAMTLTQLQQWLQTVSDLSKTLSDLGSPKACSYALEAIQFPEGAKSGWNLSRAQEVARKCSQAMANRK